MMLFANMVGPKILFDTPKTWDILSYTQFSFFLFLTLKLKHVLVFVITLNFKPMFIFIILLSYTLNLYLL